jgi:hypothetical protein
VKTVWLIGYGGYEETMLGAYSSEKAAKKAKKTFCRESGIIQDDPDFRIFSETVDRPIPPWPKPHVQKNVYLDAIAKEVYPVNDGFWKWMHSGNPAMDLIEGRPFRKINGTSSKKKTPK